MKDKLIAENQSVGDGCGWYLIRNLYEKPNGERYSVRKTGWMPCKGNEKVKK